MESDKTPEVSSALPELSFDDFFTTEDSSPIKKEDVVLDDSASTKKANVSIETPTKTIETAPSTKNDPKVKAEKTVTMAVAGPSNGKSSTSVTASATQNGSKPSTSTPNLIKIAPKPGTSSSNIIVIQGRSPKAQTQIGTTNIGTAIGKSFQVFRTADGRQIVQMKPGSNLNIANLQKLGTTKVINPVKPTTPGTSAASTSSNTVKTIQTGQVIKGNQMIKAINIGNNQKIQKIISPSTVAGGSNVSSGGKIMIKTNVDGKQVIVPQIVKLSPSGQGQMIQAINVPKGGLPSGMQYVRIVSNSNSASSASSPTKKIIVRQNGPTMRIISSSPSDSAGQLAKQQAIQNSKKMVSTVSSLRKINSDIVSGAGPKVVSIVKREVDQETIRNKPKVITELNKEIRRLASNNHGGSSNENPRIPMTKVVSQLPFRAKDSPSVVTIKTEPQQNPRKLFTVLKKPDDDIPDLKLIRKNSQSPNGEPIRRKHCNCTKSQCLKLYCDCFANGEFCQDCNCKDCLNNLEFEDERQKAIRMCLERNPSAFKPKITSSANQSDHRLHNKGCNCKRSSCLKNYCECYEAKISCSSNCKCVGCRNFEDRPDLDMDPVDVAKIVKNFGRGIAVKRTYEEMDRKTVTATTNASVPQAPAEKQSVNFITQDVVDATVQCMLAQADECSQNGISSYDTERMVLEELGRCLVEIIDFSLCNMDSGMN